MNTATPMSLSATVPPSASTRSAGSVVLGTDRDVRQAARPSALAAAVTLGVGEQLEHEAALAQVDGPQAEGRIELEQAAGDLVGCAISRSYSKPNSSS